MRILVIEDNRKLAATIKRGLEQDGYTVEIAGDGVAGEEFAVQFQNDLDVILLDLMLPRRDGVTVCRNLRKGNVKTPILMLTARDSVPDRVAGLDAGADDYLPKPFAFDELEARIRALLRRPRSNSDPILKAGRITLDPTRREVTVGKNPVTLTLKEYQFLELFMRHVEQVLTREQIVNNLWSFDYDGFSNVVDVHIKNLRKKLGDERAGAEIETVRGVGYRLSVVAAP